ncbi:MAG: hypothetical protein GC137_05185 [Alphaproteobacteria bacterium]|nr:hypothetical protein [Alphaproteobacteria bacterium]
MNNNIITLIRFCFVALGFFISFVMPSYSQTLDDVMQRIGQPQDENVIELDVEAATETEQEQETELVIESSEASNKKSETTEDMAASAEEGGEPEPESESEEVVYEEQEDTGVKPEEIPSLFFTFWQSRAIEDAKNAVGTVRPPTDAELDTIPGDDVPRDPGIRNIQLGGIVYEGKEVWTIWLNGQRVTPDSVPKEVLDLRVFDDYIELKWLDEYTNQVFPIRMRAHQRFNLDARMFLPG